MKLFFIFAALAALTLPVTVTAGSNAPAKSVEPGYVDALLATGWRPMAPTVYDGLRLLGHAVPLASLTPVAR